MKTKEQILQDLFATLSELQSGLCNGNLKALTTKLSVLYDVLEDDVPEEFWEQIEEWL